MRGEQTDSRGLKTGFGASGGIQSPQHEPLPAVRRGLSIYGNVWVGARLGRMPRLPGPPLGKTWEAGALGMPRDPLSWGLCVLEACPSGEASGVGGDRSDRLQSERTAG